MTEEQSYDLPDDKELLLYMLENTTSTYKENSKRLNISYNQIILFTAITYALTFIFDSTNKPAVSSYGIKMSLNEAALLTQIIACIYMYKFYHANLQRITYGSLLKVLIHKIHKLKLYNLLILEHPSIYSNIMAYNKLAKKNNKGALSVFLHIIPVLFPYCFAYYIIYEQWSRLHFSPIWIASSIIIVTLSFMSFDILFFKTSEKIDDYKIISGVQPVGRDMKIHVIYNNDKKT